MGRRGCGAVNHVRSTDGGVRSDRKDRLVVAVVVGIVVLSVSLSLSHAHTHYPCSSCAIFFLLIYILVAAERMDLEALDDL